MKGLEGPAARFRQFPTSLAAHESRLATGAHAQGSRQLRLERIARQVPELASDSVPARFAREHCKGSLHPGLQRRRRAAGSALRP